MSRIIHGLSSLLVAIASVMVLVGILSVNHAASAGTTTHGPLPEGGIDARCQACVISRCGPADYNYFTDGDPCADPATQRSYCEEQQQGDCGCSCQDNSTVNYYSCGCTKNSS